MGPVIVTSLCSTLLICARSSDTSCLQSIAIKAKVADLTRVLPGFLLFYLRGDLRSVVRYKLLQSPHRLKSIAYFHALVYWFIVVHPTNSSPSTFSTSVPAAVRLTPSHTYLPFLSCKAALHSVVRYVLLVSSCAWLGRGLFVGTCHCHFLVLYIADLRSVVRYELLTINCD